VNIDSGDAPLVVLCPAWKKWGMAKKVQPDMGILHSRADDLVLFTNSEELVKNCALLASAD
jgi:hypothetical protein